MCVWSVGVWTFDLVVEVFALSELCIWNWGWTLSRLVFRIFFQCVFVLLDNFEIVFELTDWWGVLIMVIKMRVFVFRR